MKQRIAFISSQSHPSRDAVERVLRASFPEYQLDVINPVELVRRRGQDVAHNLLYLSKEYGWDLLLCRRNIKQSFLRTTYAMKAIQRNMAQVLLPGRYAFSFQLQSLFDASVPEIPHFVYTDHTHLSNLEVPDFPPSSCVRRPG